MPPVYATVLPLPAIMNSYINHCGIDFGSTLVKVAHCVAATKPSASNSPQVTLELRVYTAEFLDEAIDFVKETRSSFLKSDETVNILNVTGINTFKVIDKLYAAFGKSNINVVMEFDCNKSAQHFLCACLPLASAFHEFDSASVAECGALADEIHASMKTYNEKQPDGQYAEHGRQGAPWLDAVRQFNATLAAQQRRAPADSTAADQRSFSALFPDRHLPCLMTMVGSACHWTVIGSDGVMTPVDFSTRCGVMLLGLGSLLTGAKTFEELLSLAERGDHRAVDHLNADVLSHHPDDPYSSYPDNILCFSFYKAQQQDRSAFRAEDVARSLLVTILNDVVQNTLFCAALYGVRTIFMGGNVINHALVRRELLRAVTTRRSINPKFDADIYFLQHGGYLGAIGALLMSGGRTES